MMFWEKREKEPSLSELALQKARVLAEKDEELVGVLMGKIAFYILKGTTTVVTKAIK